MVVHFTLFPQCGTLPPAPQQSCHPEEPPTQVQVAGGLEGARSLTVPAGWDLEHRGGGGSPKGLVQSPAARQALWVSQLLRAACEQGVLSPRVLWASLELEWLPARASCPLPSAVERCRYARTTCFGFCGSVVHLRRSLHGQCESTHPPLAVLVLSKVHGFRVGVFFPGSRDSVSSLQTPGPSALEWAPGHTGRALPGSQRRSSGSSCCQLVSLGKSPTW